jgi:hypothetical protein
MRAPSGDHHTVPLTGSIRLRFARRILATPSDFAPVAPARKFGAQAAGVHVPGTLSSLKETGLRFAPHMTCQTRCSRLCMSRAMPPYRHRASSAPSRRVPVTGLASLSGFFLCVLAHASPLRAQDAHAPRAHVRSGPHAVQAHRTRLPARGRPCFPIPRGPSAPKTHSLSRAHSSGSFSTLPRITACRA